MTDRASTRSVGEGINDPLPYGSPEREQTRRVFDQEDAEAREERQLEAEEFIQAGDCVVVLCTSFGAGSAAGSNWRLTPRSSARPVRAA